MHVAITARTQRGQRAVRPPAPAPTPALALVPHAQPLLDREYWLAHCEGYRVDGDEGRVGFVEAVRDEAGRRMLAVRAGRLGRRLVLVPADEVSFIVPRAERIWLRTELAS
jgi:hypothetical protein